ncbi:LCP family protein [Aerococcaceae bacterium DSM 111020]|nr:LCP family protein [Aerococcaceae bacterium DSM 111020]
MRKKLYLVISCIMTILFNIVATDSLIVAAQSSSEMVLLMGIDSGMATNIESQITNEKEFEGKVEMVAIGVIDSENEELTLISLPSDSIYNEEETINDLYQMKGTEGVIEELNEYYNLTIKEHLLFNLEGVEEIVDAMDGIEVSPPISFDSANYHFNEGEPTILNGEAAVVYRRPFEEQTDSTYTQRQEQIITGIMDKISTDGESLNVTTLLTKLSDYTVTSYNVFQLMNLGNQISEYFQNVRVYQLETMDVNTENRQIIHELMQGNYQGDEWMFSRFY